MISDQDFQELIWQKSCELYRDMPWREDTRAYFVLVSELMLQQTQVDRVVPKFLAFVAAFPDEKVLAGASLADVLKLWQGLGYNRRARFLHEAAKMIINDDFPNDLVGLMKLPGVGKNTAGALLAYAFNQPSIFVETNVRTVYIHHFFADQDEVDDKVIIEKLEQTVDREYPREFYWALMDYGSFLKANGVRNVATSRHYRKQSKLKGSIREVRGQIVRQLTGGDLSIDTLRRQVQADERFEAALAGLMKDQLVTQTGQNFHLTK